MDCSNLLRGSMGVHSKNMDTEKWKKASKKQREAEEKIAEILKTLEDECDGATVCGVYLYRSGKKSKDGKYYTEIADVNVQITF